MGYYDCAKGSFGVDVAADDIGGAMSYLMMAEPAGALPVLSTRGLVEAVEHRPGEGWFKIRHRVNGYCRPAVARVQEKWLGASGDIASDSHTYVFEYLICYSYSSCRVVITGDRDDLGTHIMQANQSLAKEGDGLNGRDCPIVEITSDDDEVYVGVLRHLDQAIDGLALLGHQ